MSWRYGRRDYGWGGFAPYVSKAEKMRMAEKARAKLAKAGADVRPIVLAGHAIASTWWGKAWNQNLERYADYSNRLPRGRSYVRSGSVLDLKITPTVVTAIVAGSRPKPYAITIKIKPLAKKVEEALMVKSRAALDSMQALLSGEFPADLKEAFLEQGVGLFPSPKEIEFSCSCPDWASMCKHVAAALYGVAVRLDEKPELFFALRGITMDDFVGQMVKRESEKLLGKAATKSARVLDAEEGEISKLFGVALEGEPAVSASVPTGNAPRVPRKKKAPQKEKKPKKRSRRRQLAASRWP